MSTPHHIYAPTSSRLRLALKALGLPALVAGLFGLAALVCAIALQLPLAGRLAIGGVGAVMLALLGGALARRLRKPTIIVEETWAMGISPDQAEAVVRCLVEAREDLHGAGVWAALEGYHVQLGSERDMVRAGGGALSTGWHDGAHKKIVVWNESSRHEVAAALWWELGHAVDQRLGPGELGQGTREEYEAARLAYRQEHGVDWDSNAKTVRERI